jgi:hypothetical protein
MLCHTDDHSGPKAVGADMDVAVWLRSLGLEQYEAAFRGNEIDDSVLPNLTAEDLKDLGVAIIGHRRKLLDAIAALRNWRERESTATRCSSGN